MQSRALLARMKSWPFLLLALVAPLPSEGTGSSAGYLVLTSVFPPKVMYSRLLTSQQQAIGKPMDVLDLYDGGACNLTTATDEGTACSGPIQRAHGVAVDNLRGLLYVADPKSMNVWAMRLFEAGNHRGRLAVDTPISVLSGIAARWVTVDAHGTIFVTDTDSGKIWSLPVTGVTQLLDDQPDPQGVLDGLTGTASGAQEPDAAESAANSASELYSIFYTPSVQAPQGIVADGFHLLWANGQTGETNGVVVRGLQELDHVSGEEQDQTVLRLSTDGDGAAGICVTGSRIFYTQGHKVMSMGQSGGEGIQISDRLDKAEGCAFDGDGTVFVADKNAGKVYSFSGGSAYMTARRLTLVADVHNVCGLAVFSSTPQPATGDSSAAAPVSTSSRLVAAATAATILAALFGS